MNTNQNSPTNDVIFYSVYLYDFDSEKCDILLNARKEYFTTKTKKKDKVFLSVDGIGQKYTYVIEKNKPLKWQKEIDGTLVEQSVIEASGTYYIDVRENNKSVKKTYFNNLHIWQKSEYKDNLIKNNNCSLVPWTNDNSIAIIKYTEDINNPIILKAVTTPTDKNLLNKLIKMVNPTASAQTSRGYYCFCEAEKASLWNNALESLTRPQSQVVVETNAKNNCNGFSFNIENFSDKIESEDIFKSATVFGEQNTEKINDIKPKQKKTATKEIIEKSIKEANDKSKINSQEDKINLPQKQITKTKIKSKEIVQDSKNQDNTKHLGSIDIDKTILVSDLESYNYFGSLDSNENRTGYGRTLLPNGKTAYEGGYDEDKRNGFGAYYYKNGKPCYVGNWQQNKRSGFGIAFRTSDYSTHVGNFTNDIPKGNCARFDKNGNLTYVGNWAKGSENGAGILVNKDGSYTVSSFANGESGAVGTIINKDGTIRYSGELNGTVKEGKGTLFDETGTIKYTGYFKNNKFHGNGRLCLQDGSAICGAFKNSQADGICTKYDSNGALQYKGEFLKGYFNGKGIKYFKNGTYLDGKFENDYPVGIVSLYSAQGLLIYKGTVQNELYNGNGILYENGQKVYEGNFIDGKKCGTGREYRNNKCIYMGNFENDFKSGFGISYNDGEPQFTGLWNNNLQSIAGVLNKGNEQYVGCFSNGLLNDRVNIVVNGIIIANCIYEKGNCVYKREYSKDGTALVFEGNISNNQKEGMGCNFTEYGEKSFEGIFKIGQPFKSMKINLKKLDSLPYIEKLKTTDYEKYRCTPVFAIEEPIGMCIYSGLLKNNLPSGKGTTLYGNHRFTGIFVNGKACGHGTVCLGDGTEITGVFTPKKQSESKQITVDNISYYYT